MPPSRRFPGFAPQALQFFRKLERNNNREWFTAHRNDYIQYVAEPMKQLAGEMIPMVQELDPNIIDDPNRSVSRIYRDARYTQGQPPYRPNVWIAFKRETECWTDKPVFFFEVTAQSYIFGMGMYCAKAAAMQNFRRQIDADPLLFAEIIRPLKKSKALQLESEQYKRPLGCEHPKNIVPWYQSKSIAVIGTREPDKTLFSPKITDFLMGQFLLTKPLYDFLWKAAG